MARRVACPIMWSGARAGRVYTERPRIESERQQAALISVMRTVRNQCIKSYVLLLSDRGLGDWIIFVHRWIVTEYGGHEAQQFIKRALARVPRVQVWQIYQTILVYVTMPLLHSHVCAMRGVKNVNSTAERSVKQAAMKISHNVPAVGVT